MGNLLGVGILNTRVTCTAMVVNGDQSQLAMLSGILQQDGLQVTSYENAEDALVLMNAQVDEKGPPDVIITDLYTPGLDGWRFCQLLRSMEYPAFNSTPVLVTSPAMSGVDPREVLSSLGANEFLTAPYDSSGLLSKVANSCSGSNRKSMRRSWSSTAMRNEAQHSRMPSRIAATR